MFCPKCGSIILSQNFGKKNIFVCSGCDKEFSSVEMKIREVTKAGKDFGVMDGWDPLAVHEHTCSKCGYDKAEIIDKGIWYSDEDNVILFKCGKCGHTEMADAKVQ